MKRENKRPLTRNATVRPSVRALCLDCLGFCAFVSQRKRAPDTRQGMQLIGGVGLLDTALFTNDAYERRIKAYGKFFQESGRCAD